MRRRDKQINAVSFSTNAKVSEKIQFRRLTFTHFESALLPSMRTHAKQMQTRRIRKGKGREKERGVWSLFNSFILIPSYFFSPSCSQKFSKPISSGNFLKRTAYALRMDLRS